MVMSTEKIHTAEKSLASIEAQVKEKEEQKAVLEKKLPFATKEEATASLSVLKKTVTDYDAGKENAEKNRQKTANDLSAAKAAAAALKAQVSDMELTEEPELLKLETETKADLKEKEKMLKDLNIRIASNKRRECFAPTPVCAAAVRSAFDIRRSARAGRGSAHRGGALRRPDAPAGRHRMG